jgi:hypothetical protein
MGRRPRTAVTKSVLRRINKSKNASHHPMWSKLAMRADTASAGIAVGAMTILTVRLGE